MKISKEEFDKAFHSLEYTPDDFHKITWAEFDTVMEKIANDVRGFLSESGLSVRYIVPILRGAAIPAVVLSHKLSVVDMMPVQINCLGKGRTEMLFDPTPVPMAPVAANECVIVVEDNQGSGGTANQVIEIVKKKFGADVKIIFVRLTTSWGCEDRVPGMAFIATGFLTNEMKLLPAGEDPAAHGITVTKLACFPWETPEEELKKMAMNRARP